MGRKLVGHVAELRNRIVAETARRSLTRVREGKLEVRDDGVRGSKTVGPPSAPLVAQLEVRDTRAWSLLAQGSIGLGEGYAEGLWDTDDLLTVLRIAARELDRVDGMRIGLRWPRALLHQMRGLVPRNTHSGARRNISAHYDLGNDLFRSFLDQRMQYSCGIYGPDASRLEPEARDSTHPETLEPTRSDGLEQAQLRKLNRICRRLELEPNDHLLEIGTGWGGLAIHAATHYGCRVTTTTISREQRELAISRVAAAGLSDRVKVLDRDYRDLTGSYDKLVSVEMIEAVGWQYFSLFFQRCAELLHPGGRMLLQAITLPDHLYETEKATRTFANTHVFPGGCLPSEQVIEKNAASAGLRSLDIKRIGGSYAPTLAAWRSRFLTAWDSHLATQYDTRFRRLWEFYLTYCEAGFRERRIDDIQILFEKAQIRPRFGESPAYPATVAAT